MLNLDSKALWLPGMDESMIFMPEEIEDLLCILPHSDATKSEQDAALLVNKSSCELLKNQIEVDTYMDIVESVGIDPRFHMQRALWVVSNLL
ncbi:MULTISPECIES: hypothetical protein [unclassified Microcoleus]|uniref:hypothetical protein n=1 Tax=unclassified Microcoleus TaxID=2642155 RepID=UPI002FD475B0